MHLDSVGKRLALVRKTFFNLSQDALAAKLGVTLRQYQRYEANVSSIPGHVYTTLGSLNDAIDMSVVNWIETGEGEPPLTSAVNQMHEPQAVYHVLNFEDCKEKLALAMKEIAMLRGITEYQEDLINVFKKQAFNKSVS